MRAVVELSDGTRVEFEGESDEVRQQVQYVLEHSHRWVQPPPSPYPPTDRAPWRPPDVQPELGRVFVGDPPGSTSGSSTTSPVDLAIKVPGCACRDCSGDDSRPRDRKRSPEPLEPMSGSTVGYPL